jgi:hypothetical protein
MSSNDRKWLYSFGPVVIKYRTLRENQTKNTGLL